MAVSRPSSLSRHERDLDPPPWPHLPWLTTRPHPVAGFVRQKGARVPPPPTRGRGVGSTSEASSPREQGIGEDEVVIDFFGLLWAIDSPPLLMVNKYQF